MVDASIGLGGYQGELDFVRPRARGRGIKHIPGEQRDGVRSPAHA